MSIVLADMIKTSLWNDDWHGFIAKQLLHDQCLYSPLMVGILFIYSGGIERVP
ncbi:hypothetical protein PMIT1303_01471 [Prochlorococcus sp. MIT 1303]|nr:hypothetical protein PMIT1303_01471 [Prochlorococcus sp. MIT 1303]